MVVLLLLLTVTERVIVITNEKNTHSAIVHLIFCIISQVRILDVATGQVILVSHHPGKNPYEKLDPLGLGNSGKQHSVMGGEWESATDVSSRHPSMPSFKIRPKPMSAHGRQYIKTMHGEFGETNTY